MIRGMTLMAALAALLVAASVQAAEPIKIGAVFSITGPASFLGEPERNSLEMEVAKINAAGGVLGRPIELTIYDDETDVNKCVLAVDKLLKKDKVAVVIGPTTSGNTLAIVNKFPAAKVPLISCASAEKITTPVNPWVFKVAPSDRYAALRILEHARKSGYKKLAIITVSDGFGQAGRGVLQELVPAQGFTLVADEIYGPKDTDMTAQLTKIKSLAPDAVICWGTNPGPAVISRNRVQIGMSTPLYQSHGVASKKFIELAGDAAEGLLLPAGRLIVAGQLAEGHPQKPVLMGYSKDYETKYKAAVSTFGGHAYDAVHLVADAVKRTGSAEPQAIRDGIEKITAFVGTAGIFTFGPTEHNGLDASAFEMIRIEKGDWKIAD
ncbi:MAG: ABC transporter substrate-binding protein [Thermodesulfobacteriota bacterium]